MSAALASLIFDVLENYLDRALVIQPGVPVGRWHRDGATIAQGCRGAHLDVLPTNLSP